MQATYCTAIVTSEPEMNALLKRTLALPAATPAGMRKSTR
jgi:hypothetical protein